MLRRGMLGRIFRGQFGIPIFGWRQIMPNHFAEKQLRPRHGASIRRNPGFGITPPMPHAA
jgi:hypothetical protein